MSPGTEQRRSFRLIWYDHSRNLPEQIASCSVSGGLTPFRRALSLQIEEHDHPEDHHHADAGQHQRKRKVPEDRFIGRLELVPALLQDADPLARIPDHPLPQDSSARRHDQYIRADRKDPCSH